MEQGDTHFVPNLKQDIRPLVPNLKQRDRHKN